MLTIMIIIVDNNDNNCDNNDIHENMEHSDPMNISCGKRAKAKGFNVHNVPGDDNCLFHAVSYQLPNIGIQCIELVQWLLSIYEQIPQLMVYTCVIIIMTNDEDDFSIVWERFLDDLSNNAWADNIAIQGLSDMLCVTFSIVSTQNPNVIQVCPNEGESNGTIYLEHNEFIDNENKHDQYVRQITGTP